MKTLILIRHAKSSWEDDVNDLNRPLSLRGFSDANSISNEFKSYDFHPDGIFSSPAKRAATTCDVFMENLKLSKSMLVIENQLYDFGGDQVLGFIKSLKDDLNKVMIFGHNHAFTSLANSLGDTYIDNLPTSGLVMINFDIDHWKDLNVGKTQLILTPKDFK